MAHLFDNILQNFQTSKRNVNRYLSVGIVFTLVCFFYIVEPYFTYTSYQQKAQEQQKAVREKLEQTRDQIEEMNKVNANAQRALSSIRSRIDHLPEHLHGDALPKIQDALNSNLSNQSQAQQIQQVQSNQQVNAALFPPDITDFNKAVNWYIQNWFKQLVADLKQDVVDPITSVSLSRTVNQGSTLDTLTQTAITDINNHLETIDPNFWHSYQGPGGKVSTAESLQEVVNESFEPVQNQLNQLLQVTTESMAAMQTSLESRENVSQELEKNIESLDDRITSMSSPFGPIPLRTTELIILFPILLVILMVLSISAMRKSSQLYDELWAQYAVDQKEHSMQQFQLYTDCWYLPPYPNLVQTLLLAVFAAVVAGIYIYSSLLIYSEPALFTFPGSGAETARYAFFIGAYGLGLIVLAGCIGFGYKNLFKQNLRFRGRNQ